MNNILIKNNQNIVLIIIYFLIKEKSYIFVKKINIILILKLLFTYLSIEF